MHKISLYIFKLRIYSTANTRHDEISKKIIMVDDLTVPFCNIIMNVANLVETQHHTRTNII